MDKIKRTKKIMFIGLVFAIILIIQTFAYATDDSSVFFYDLEDVFNGSVIAECEENADTDWGIRDNENIGGFKKSTIKDWLENGILYQDANDFNRFGQVYEALPSHDIIALQKEKIPFSLGKSLTASGKNAYIFDNAKGRRTLTLDGSTMKSDFLCFAFAVNHNSVNVKIKVVFFDDSERIFDNIPLEWARAEDGWKYSCQRPELELIDGKITKAENVDKNSVKIRGIAVPTDGKRVKKIQISGGYSDNAGTALLAITQLSAEKTESLDESMLLKRIESFSVKDKNEITASNAKKVILACNSYLELIKRNYRFEEQTESADFYKELSDRASYVSAVTETKTDKNGLSFYADIADGEEGRKNAEITILNSTDKEINCTFVFAVYVDGLLADISVGETVSVSSEAVKTQALSAEKTENAEYKIFVLENFGNLKPLYTFFYEEK